MYGKCGLLQEAREIFDSMGEKTLVSWNAMIASYAQHGNGREAIGLFQRMNLEGLQPDRSSFISVLDACGGEAVSQGRQVHAQIVVSVRYDLVLATALMNMYGKGGLLDEAHRIFNKIIVKDVVTWNVLIAANAQNGKWREAVVLFQRMQLQGLKPNKLTFVSSINACANCGDVMRGQTMHDLVADCGLKSDVVVTNTLINLYKKCSRVSEARELFDRMVDRDIVSWNGMIAAYAQSGDSQNALRLFWRMELEGQVHPNRITFVSVLDACGSTVEATGSRVFHSRMKALGLEHDTVIGNALVNMYAKLGLVCEAVRLFEELITKNNISWNAIITTCSRHGYSSEALQFLKRMDQEGIKACKVTFLCALDACTEIKTVKDLHKRIVENGLNSDEAVGNTLVNVYGRCQSFEEARSAFDTVVSKTVVSWNTVLGACCQNGFGSEAVQLHREMAVEGITSDRVTLTTVLDACTEIGDAAEGRLIHEEAAERGLVEDLAVSNALISFYGKLGSLEQASDAFDKTPDRNLVSYNAMISACVQRGFHSKAIEVFQSMDLEGVRADAITFVGVLDACADLAEISRAKLLHRRIRESGLTPDDVLGNCLIRAYSKCGSLEDAGNVFGSMPRRDSFTWNGVIAIYSQHGYGKTAVKLFRTMQQEGTQADSVSFVNLVSACSHAGLLREAICYFSSMRWDFDVAPAQEHCNAMVDLLGRAGWLEEAEEFVAKMPVGGADPIAWRSLVSACTFQQGGESSLVRSSLERNRELVRDRAG